MTHDSDALTALALTKIHNTMLYANHLQAAKMGVPWFGEVEPDYLRITPDDVRTVDYVRCSVCKVPVVQVQAADHQRNGVIYVHDFDGLLAHVRKYARR